MKIKATPATIWKRPAYLPYVHPPLTDEVIRRAERQLGCSLPSAFLDILRVQNGGPIRFRIPDSVSELIFGIGPSFPSITACDLIEHQEYVDVSLEGLVPFDGDGHWFYCLDFRSDGKNPSVSYVDVECNSERQIADDFASFMGLMELDINQELVITNVANLDDARARLEASFGSPFEKKVSNVGVPYLKCQAGRKRDECFWIKGNKVAQGYSGDAPGSFQFHGETLLIPELSADAVIFDAGESHNQRYRAKLLNAGFALLSIEEAAIAK